MWFGHLKQKSDNRANGAKKAAETRKKNKEQRQGDVMTEDTSKPKKKGQKGNKKRKRQVANSKQDKKKSGSRGNEETEKANENMKCKQSEESSICKDCGMSNPRKI